MNKPLLKTTEEIALLVMYALFLFFVNDVSTLTPTEIEGEMEKRHGIATHVPPESKDAPFRTVYISEDNLDSEFTIEVEKWGIFKKLGDDNYKIAKNDVENTEILKNILPDLEKLGFTLLADIDSSEEYTYLYVMAQDNDSENQDITNKHTETILEYNKGLQEYELDDARLEEIYQMLKLLADNDFSVDMIRVLGLYDEVQGYYGGVKYFRDYDSFKSKEDVKAAIDKSLENLETKWYNED